MRRIFIHRVVERGRNESSKQKCLCVSDSEILTQKLSAQEGERWPLSPAAAARLLSPVVRIPPGGTETLQEQPGREGDATAAGVEWAMWPTDKNSGMEWGQEEWAQSMSRVLLALATR